MQAAIGLAQLKKLPNFTMKRKKNFQRLLQHLSLYKKFLVFTEAEKNADPCWFGFMIVIKPNAPFTRLELVEYLEGHNIATRSLFGGNLLRHPAFLKETKVRKVGTFKNSDLIMTNGFWIGVYPGITNEMLDYVLNTFDQFMTKFVKL